MKKLPLLIIPVLILSALAGQSFAQTKKELKATEKAERKAAEEERKRITVDFTQLVKFPSSYTGRQYRIYRVGLGDVQPYTDDGVTYYLFDVKTATDSTMAFPISDAVTFAMQEGMAREYVAQRQAVLRRYPYGSNNIPIGDVYFELFQRDLGNRRYWIAKVSCIAVIDVYAEQKRRPVGECPLVK